MGIRCSDNKIVDLNDPDNEEKSLRCWIPSPPISILRFTFKANKKNGCSFSGRCFIISNDSTDTFVSDIAFRMTAMIEWFNGVATGLYELPVLQAVVAGLCTFVLEDPTTVGSGLLVAEGKMLYWAAFAGLSSGIALGTSGCISWAVLLISEWSPGDS